MTFIDVVVDDDSTSEKQKETKAFRSAANTMYTHSYNVDEVEEEETCENIPCQTWRPEQHIALAYGVYVTRRYCCVIFFFVLFSMCVYDEAIYRTSFLSRVFVRIAFFYRFDSFIEEKKQKKNPCTVIALALNRSAILQISVLSTDFSIQIQKQFDAM